MSKNGWTNHLVTSVSQDDYLSLDEDEAMKPRDIYGGLPRKFGRLVYDSNMIDAGDTTFEESLEVWQQLVSDFPFLQRAVKGNARDIGPYEASYDTSSAIVITTVKASPADAKCKKAIHNARIVIKKDGHYYNIQGQKITP
jgi:hypothetical protein